MSDFCCSIVARPDDDVSGTLLQGKNITLSIHLVCLPVEARNSPSSPKKMPRGVEFWRRHDLRDGRLIKSKYSPILADWKAEDAR